MKANSSMTPGEAAKDDSLPAASPTASTKSEEEPDGSPTEEQTSQSEDTVTSAVEWIEEHTVEKLERPETAAARYDEDEGWRNECRLMVEEKVKSLHELLGYLKPMQHEPATDIVDGLEATLVEALRMAGTIQQAEQQRHDALMTGIVKAFSSRYSPRPRSAPGSARFDQRTASDDASGPRTEKGLEMKKKSSAAEASPATAKTGVGYAAKGLVSLWKSKRTPASDRLEQMPTLTFSPRYEDYEEGPGDPKVQSSIQGTFGMGGPKAQSPTDTTLAGHLELPQERSDSAASVRSDGMPFSKTDQQHDASAPLDQGDPRATGAGEQDTPAYLASYQRLPQQEQLLPEGDEIEDTEHFVFPSTPEHEDSQQRHGFPAMQDAPLDSTFEQDTLVDAEMTGLSASSAGSSNPMSDVSPGTVLKHNGERYRVAKTPSEGSPGLQHYNNLERVQWKAVSTGGRGALSWIPGAGMSKVHSALAHVGWRSLSAVLDQPAPKTNLRVGSREFGGHSFFVEDIDSSWNSPTSSRQRSTVAGVVLPVQHRMRSAFWGFIQDQFLAWWHVFKFFSKLSYLIFYIIFDIVFVMTQNALSRVDFPIGHSLPLPVMSRVPEKYGLIAATHMMILGSMLVLSCAVGLEQERLLWVAANGMTRIHLIDYLRDGWAWSWIAGLEPRLWSLQDVYHVFLQPREEL